MHDDRRDARVFESGHHIEVFGQRRGSGYEWVRQFQAEVFSREFHDALNASSGPPTSRDASKVPDIAPFGSRSGGGRVQPATRTAAGRAPQSTGTAPRAPSDW